MNTRKTIVKISYGLIAALVIVLVGLLIYQQRLIRQMASNEASTPSTSGIAAEVVEASGENTLSSSPTQTLSGSNDLKYQLEATEEELDMAREDLANEFDRQAEQAQNTIELQKKLLQNPATKKMMRTNIKNMMELQYGDLFAALGLSEEDTAAFKEMLADQQMQQLELSMQLMDQSLSEEEKKEIGSQIVDQKNEFDTQLSNLLGTEKFELYKNYQERSSERQLVFTYTSTIDTSEALTDNQKQDLIEAMYQARKSVEAEYGYDSTDIEQSLGVGKDTNELMDQQLERMDSTFKRYIDSARGILSESQATQFEKQIKEQQEMMTMSINFARQLYGGNSKAE